MSIYTIPRTQSCILIVALIGTQTFAGQIRHDRDDARYTDLAAQPQFVPTAQIGNFETGGYRASATLIGDENNQWLLTAAHNFVVPSLTGEPIANAVRLTSSDGETLTARFSLDDVYFPNGKQGVIPQGYEVDLTIPDLALVRLREPVDATPARLYNGTLGSEIGKTLTYVGYGSHGDGLNGLNSSQVVDLEDRVAGLKFIKRAGQNVIDAVAVNRGQFDSQSSTPPHPDPNHVPGPGLYEIPEGIEPNFGPERSMLITDFDHPNDTTWNFSREGCESSPVPLDLEYIGAPGDSGGSAYVQVGDDWFLAGVITQGIDPYISQKWVDFPDDEEGFILQPDFSNREDLGAMSYGIVGGSASVTANLDWIQSTMTVPEPTTSSLGMAFALALIGLSRHRRNS